MKVIAFVINVMLCTVIIGQKTELPIEMTEFKRLNNFSDAQLQVSLEKVINENKNWSNLIKNKQLCLGVVDLSDPQMPRYAHINGRHMMYAASLPKIAILLAVMDAVDQGKIEFTPDVDALLHKMIRYSNNQASTALIDLVGYENIQATLEDDRFDLYEQDKHGGLWVGKRYAAGGRRFPEPLKGLSHAATVNQVCRFYYMLAYGQLVNCDVSEQMMEYLVDPGIHHKFVFTLDKLAPEAEIYRKSGSWRNYHADSILVVGEEWRNYILVALAESSNGESILREVALKVDELLNKNK